MAVEEVQAQAGQRSIESTCTYVFLANTWLVQRSVRPCRATSRPPRGRCESEDRQK